MTGLPGTTSVRKVRITSKVDAIVSATVTVTDDEVREHFDLDPGEEIDWELVEEYALEETDESMYDLESIEMYNSNTVALLSTERKHVAPPEFVPLPGMEGL